MVSLYGMSLYDIECHRTIMAIRSQTVFLGNIGLTPTGAHSLKAEVEGWRMAINHTGRMTLALRVVVLVPVLAGLILGSSQLCIVCRRNSMWVVVAVKGILICFWIKKKAVDIRQNENKQIRKGEWDGWK